MKYCTYWKCCSMSCILYICSYSPSAHLSVQASVHLYVCVLTVSWFLPWQLMMIQQPTLAIALTYPWPIMFVLSWPQSPIGWVLSPTTVPSMDTPHLGNNLRQQSMLGTMSLALVCLYFHSNWETDEGGSYISGAISHTLLSLCT